MDTTTLLTYITLVVALLVVALLVVYLVAIIIALRRAGDHLQALAGGLQMVKDNTAPLPAHLTTINGALATLNGGLISVNSHLEGVAEVLELK